MHAKSLANLWTLVLEPLCQGENRYHLSGIIKRLENQSYGFKVGKMFSTAYPISINVASCLRDLNQQITSTFRQRIMWIYVDQSHFSIASSVHRLVRKVPVLESVSKTHWALANCHPLLRRLWYSSHVYTTPDTCSQGSHFASSAVPWRQQSDCSSHSTWKVSQQNYIALCDAAALLHVCIFSNYHRTLSSS